MDKQKKTIKIAVRFYKYHDMDLIPLLGCKDFNFSKTVKKALLAYIDGRSYFIRLPEIKRDNDAEHSMFKCIYLNKNNPNDLKIIKWLDSIKVKPKCKTGLIKSILRGCIIGPSLAACVSDVNATNRQYEKYIALFSELDEIESVEGAVKLKSPKKPRMHENPDNPHESDKSDKPHKSDKTKSFTDSADKLVNLNVPTECIVETHSHEAGNDASVPSNETDVFNEGFGSFDFGSQTFGDETDTASEEDDFDMFRDIQNIMNAFR